MTRHPSDVTDRESGKVRAFEVRSFDGTHGDSDRRADALREAEAVAAAAGRFVFICHNRGLGAFELLPYCPAPGDTISPNGGTACGRGDVGDSLYCPAHLADHHPEPKLVPCPLCNARAGDDCLVTTGGGNVWTAPDGKPRAMLQCHEGRHQTAIAADGRTLAGEEVPGCQAVLF